MTLCPQCQQKCENVTSPGSSIQYDFCETCQVTWTSRRNPIDLYFERRSLEAQAGEGRAEMAAITGMKTIYEGQDQFGDCKARAQAVQDHQDQTGHASILKMFWEDFCREPGCSWEAVTRIVRGDPFNPYGAPATMMVAITIEKA